MKVSSPLIILHLASPTKVDETNIYFNETIMNISIVMISETKAIKLIYENTLDLWHNTIW